jgi:hypothetical protein
MFMSKFTLTALTSAIVLAGTICSANAAPSVAAVESLVISPNGLNCKQVAQLAQQIASMRETGTGQDTVRGLIGGADKVVDAVINDVYAMRLSQERARMHVMELCIVKMQQSRR